MSGKPVIIYSMPRTRSSAVLESCLRNTRIFEPFNPEILFGTPSFPDEIFENSVQLNRSVKIRLDHAYPQYAINLEPEYLNHMFSQLNAEDTACKIISDSLGDFLPARHWFMNADLNNTHDIFVLVRDLREQMLSFLLAMNFGYFKSTEIQPSPVVIHSSAIFQLRRTLDAFLRFFPTNAKLITFESLPDSHFDRSKILIKNQNSLYNLSQISNLEYCEMQIACLLEYYMDEWNSKILNIPYA
jgi:hypothetical protein